MTELRGFYTLWLREVKRYLRDRTRLVSSFVQPLLWLVMFGVGIGASLRGAVPIPGLTYQQLIFPGIVGQTLLFTVHVHGHISYLGQRIRFHERNLGCACFAHDHISWQNGWRQHRRPDSRSNRARPRLSVRNTNRS